MFPLQIIWSSIGYRGAREYGAFPNRASGIDLLPLRRVGSFHLYFPVGMQAGLDQKLQDFIPEFFGSDMIVHFRSRTAAEASL